MKKTVIILLTCITLAATSLACTGSGLSTQIATTINRSVVHGSAHISAREIPAIRFSELHASHGVTVSLVPSGDKIRIEANDNLIDHVTVESVGSTLRISTNKYIKKHNSHIHVTVPTDGRIKALTASSLANIICETPIEYSSVTLCASSSATIIAAVTATLCQLDASSSGEIKAGVSAKRCIIEASSSADIIGAIVTNSCKIQSSSSADITLSGEADECSAKCSSSSDYNAKKFIVKRYNISASSSAEANINCTEQLTALASSDSSIEYHGNCKAQAQTSRGGSIDKY